MALKSWSPVTLLPQGKKKKECKIHSALFAAVMSNGETPEQLREGTGVGLSAEESPSS